MKPTILYDAIISASILKHIPIVIFPKLQTKLCEILKIKSISSLSIPICMDSLEDLNDNRSKEEIMNETIKQAKLDALREYLIDLSNKNINNNNGNI